jgi:hypothetical protein
MKKLILLFLTYSAFAASPAKDLYQNISQKLVEFKKCDLEKVWPGYSWDEIDYFYFSSSLSMQTFFFDFQNEVEIPLRFEDTPSFAFATYAREIIEDKTYISYKLDNWRSDGVKEEQNLMQLILHENFHFFGQKNIKERYARDRGNSYPYKIKPRLYRAMVLYHLSQALKDPSQVDQHFAHAKYWNDKHKFEFNEDYLTTGDMDLREGTATYAELYSFIMLYNNCEFNKVTFDELFFQTEYGDSHITKHYHYTEADKDGQSYAGGMLAFMLDKVLFNGAFELREQAADGIHPIEALVEDSFSEESELVTEIEEEVTNTINKANAEAKVVVDEYKELESSGYQLVSFAESDIQTQGSFRLSAFINTDEITFGFYQVMQNLNALYENDSTRIKINGVNTYEVSQNDCGEYQYTFWVKDLIIADSINHKSELVKIKSENFKIKNNILCLK